MPARGVCFFLKLAWGHSAGVQAQPLVWEIPCTRSNPQAGACLLQLPGCAPGARAPPDSTALSSRALPAEPGASATPRGQGEPRAQRLARPQVADASRHIHRQSIKHLLKWMQVSPSELSEAEPEVRASSVSPGLPSVLTSLFGVWSECVSVCTVRL